MFKSYLIYGEEDHMLYLSYEIYYITLYIIYMIYFEGFVLYQLATQWYTQWYIEMILMIDHGYMQALNDL